MQIPGGAVGENRRFNSGRHNTPADGAAREDVDHESIMPAHVESRRLRCSKKITKPKD